MTAPKEPMTTKVTEALERVLMWYRRYSEGLAELGGTPLPEDLLAAATFKSALEDYEKLKAELATTNKAWDIKQKQLETARAELEKVKAEVVHWKDEARDAGERALSVVIDLEKAECLTHFRGKDGMGTCDPGCQWYPGEGQVCPMSREGLMADLEKAEAELDRWRPLIEATENADGSTFLSVPQNVLDDLPELLSILRAALKCQEKAIPERDK